MRIVVQRVSRASVAIEGRIKSEIGKGMLILLGIEDADNEDDVEWLCSKLSKLRIFSDEKDAMNLDINQIEGSFFGGQSVYLARHDQEGQPSEFHPCRPPGSSHSAV